MSRNLTPQADDARPTKRARITPPSASGSERSESVREGQPGLFPAHPSASPTPASTPTPTPAPVTLPNPSQPRPRQTAAELFAFVGATLHDVRPTTVEYLPALRTAYTGLVKGIPNAAVDGPDSECKLWLALADVGIMVLDSRAARSAVPDWDWSWANNAADAVDRAVGKGLVLVQKHASLRTHRLTFTLLHARLASHQGKAKFAQTVLRRLLASFSASDSRQQLYTAHLALVSHLLTMEDIPSAVTALQCLQDVASANGDANVVILVIVERLRLLVSGDMWVEVEAALEEAEVALDLKKEFPVLEPEPEPAHGVQEGEEQGAPEPTPEKPPPAPPAPTDVPAEPWRACLQLYTLILGVLAYTHVSSARAASVRLAALHARMDAGAAKMFPDAAVAVPLRESAEVVEVQTTHPAALFRLTFLVSAAAKRDPLSMGPAGTDGKMEPKRRLYAREGLAIAERDRDVQVPAGWNLHDAIVLDQTMARIRADLLSEMVSIAVMRSEFAEAESRLAQLVAHLRNAELWDAYAPRVFLHTGHIAQALLRPGRAHTCYTLAARLSPSDGELHLAARLCDVALRWGEQSRGPGYKPEPKVGGVKRKKGAAAAEWADAGVPRVERDEVDTLVRMCEEPGTGATLRAVGHILAACVTDEVLRIKQHLKAALELASDALDNGLRAPILALTSALYTHTAAPHAHIMLRTARKIARELRAAPLEAWVAARLAELYKRTGKEERASKTLEELKECETRVKALRARGQKGGKKKR